MLPEMNKKPNSIKVVWDFLCLARIRSRLKFRTLFGQRGKKPSLGLQFSLIKSSVTTVYYRGK